MTLEANKSYLAPVWARYSDVLVERGQGPYIYAVDGQRYLDFTCGIGVTNTGHCHPRVVEAIREQAGLLLHGQANILYHKPMLQLVEALRQIVPAQLDRFFFSNSGAEIVEASLKLARQATGRSDVIAFSGGFHGRTYGAMALTSSKSKYRGGFAPLPSGVHIAPYAAPYAFAIERGLDPESSAEAAADYTLRQLRHLLATQAYPDDVAAMIVEPVLGEGGYIVPPVSFLQGLRQICDEIGALLIIDEVQTGFGRTGKWFAHEYAQITPDILLMAKGIASGLPLSALAAKAEIMERWHPGSHGGTYGGNALACAAAVAAIETPDPLTVDIKTSTRLGTVLSNLSMLGIAPAAALEDPDFFTAPFGTGPYQVAAFTPSQFVALERNPEYRGDPAPTARLEYRYIPEVSGRITALENNEIDITWGLPPDQVEQVRSSQSLTVESFPTYGNYYMWYNSSREPFTDARVRQAMWHAVDMEEIKAFLFEGTAEVARGPIPLDVFGAAEQAPYAYDPDRARQLLAEAGYPNGFSTTMMWSSQCCTNIREFAETLISYWAAVGVQVTPQELERATWLENLLALNWDSPLAEGNTITGDADFTLARLYLSSANRMGYANPELDELLLAARAEIDQTRRAELYAEAGRIIWEEAVGIFPLDMMMHAVYRNEVTGFVPTPTGMPRFDTVSKQ